MVEKGSDIDIINPGTIVHDPFGSGVACIEGGVFDELTECPLQKIDFPVNIRRRCNHLPVFSHLSGSLEGKSFGIEALDVSHAGKTGLEAGKAFFARTSQRRLYFVPGDYDGHTAGDFEG